jgi:hypothetical protein
MPAPANDDWSAAQAISDGGVGTYDAVTGTNVSATSETGEPANNGFTVWYSFTPTVSRPILFATDYQPNATGLVSYPNPYLQTKLQVFTGSAVNALTEVTYLPQTAKTRYGNWDFGGQVAFVATADTTYYIRVDSLTATSGQGEFVLYEADWYNLDFNSCSGCPNQFSPGWVCVGTASPTVAAADDTVSFGTQPAGMYFIAYCGGAFQYRETADSGEPPPFVNWTIAPTEAELYSVYIGYDFGGTGDGLTTVIGFPSLGASEYNSYAECENALRAVCYGTQVSSDESQEIYAEFFYGGTGIGTNGPDIQTGPQNPTWGLYQLYPQLSITGVCAEWTTPGSKGSVTFTINNLDNIIEWTNVSATLAASGGASGATAQTGITLSPGASATVTVPFDASSSSVTATIQISCTLFPATVDFVFNLAPIITLVSVSADTHSGNCTVSGGSHVQGYFTITVKNSGLWSLNLTPSFTGSVTGGWISDGSCNVVSAGTATAGEFEILCGAEESWGQYVIFSTTPVTATMTLTDESGAVQLSWSEPFAY